VMWWSRTTMAQCRYAKDGCRPRGATTQRKPPALAKIQNGVASGTYVNPSDQTVEQACADWLAGSHAPASVRVAKCSTRIDRYTFAT
jgi:hypothetical protein